MTDQVELSRDDRGVATVRLSRPPVNAIDTSIVAALHDAARTLHADDDVRAVVLWGGPRAFAAGADIRQMVDATPQSFAGPAAALQAAMRALAELPQVVVAAINGPALGGGCELALTADFRVAGRSARLGQPEILLGLIPGAGGTQRLPRLVGAQVARELIYSGRTIEADEARAIGLVDHVVDDDAVFDEATALARRYADGPYALRLAKRALDGGADLGIDDALRLETALFAACFATDDAATGVRSFVADGPGRARFAGR